MNYDDWKLAPFDPHFDSSEDYDYARYKNLPYREIDGAWFDADGEEVAEETAWRENDKECARQDEVERDNEEAFWRE